MITDEEIQDAWIDADEGVLRETILAFARLIEQRAREEERKACAGVWVPVKERDPVLKQDYLTETLRGDILPCFWDHFSWLFERSIPEHRPVKWLDVRMPG